MSEFKRESAGKKVEFNLNSTKNAFQSGSIPNTSTVYMILRPLLYQKKCIFEVAKRDITPADCSLNWFGVFLEFSKNSSTSCFGHIECVSRADG